MNFRSESLKQDEKNANWKAPIKTEEGREAFAFLQQIAEEGGSVGKSLDHLTNLEQRGSFELETPNTEIQLDEEQTAKGIKDINEAALIEVVRLQEKIRKIPDQSEHNGEIKAAA